MSKNLFQLGKFVLHSGLESHFKIDCDALTSADLDCVAIMLTQRLPKFGSVDGIPKGGVALARKMEQYATEGPLLICDDVWTTGSSMRKFKDEGGVAGKLDLIIGAVIFARSCVDPWVYPLFQMTGVWYRG